MDIKKDYPKLYTALELLSMDSDMPLRKEIAVPANWIERIEKAERELKVLTDEELYTFAIGEFTEAEKSREKCPIADAVLESAFEGELNTIFYEE